MLYFIIHHLSNAPAGCDNYNLFSKIISLNKRGQTRDIRLLNESKTIFTPNVIVQSLNRYIKHLPVMSFSALNLMLARIKFKSVPVFALILKNALLDDYEHEMI